MLNVGRREVQRAAVVRDPVRPSGGNPYRVGVDGDQATCVAMFRREVAQWPADRLAPLRGKDLACWCALDQPCHADVLIEIANA